MVLAGGSGGIGSAVVEQLIEEGARLVISYRANRDRAARWEGTATVIQADLAESAGRTRLLDAAAAGDKHAAANLLPLIYAELRQLAAAQMAQEAPGQTLDATALVHDSSWRRSSASEAFETSSRRKISL